MNRAVREVLADPELRRRFLDLGVEARASTPEALGARMRADVERWAEVIRKAGISAP